LGKAPTPKSEPRHEIAERKKVDISFLLEYEGETYALRKSRVGPADDRICRQQTGGYSLQGAFNMIGRVEAFGGDVVVMLLWMAKRKTLGKKSLSYAEVERLFESNDEIEEQVTITVFDGNTGLPFNESGQIIEDAEVVYDPES
jgi:hypothetical protein